MKIFPALIAAFLMTTVVGVSLLAIGGNALLNQNTVPVTDSPKAVSAASSSSQASAQSTEAQQIQQLQNLVQTYQQREKQYQTQLNDAAQRLNQENQQVQSYQQLLEALQQQGIIRITADGQILIPRQRFNDSDNGFFGGNN